MRIQKPWAEVLNHWDSGWYTLIVEEGYEGPRFAFYPLYPWMVRAAGQLLNSGFLTPLGLEPLSTPLVGSVVSTLFFFGATYLVTRWPHARPEPRAQGPISDAKGLLISKFGWLFVVMSPASYVFHTHHTESLYFFLSLAAFLKLAKGSWIWASLFGGLCGLTKNQGIFLALALGVGCALLDPGLQEHDRGRLSIRMKRFVLSGLVSGTIFFLYPLYCYIKTGDFLAFYAAQMHWRPEMSEFSYGRAFIFANPWQNTNLGSLIRYGWFWLLVLAVVGLLRAKMIVMGLYALLFVGVMPLSGEFVGTFRYSSVLFPVWFFYGRYYERFLLKAVSHQGRGVSWVAFVVTVLGLLYLNLTTYRSYLLGRWSY